MINNLRMKISKSWILFICLFSGLFISVQSTLATATTPVIIRKDDDEPHPGLPNRGTLLLPVSGTIDDVSLVIYFEEYVGDALITVYDANDQVVYQTIADTENVLTEEISSSNWSAGDYYVTISYGDNNLIGDFTME